MNQTVEKLKYITAVVLYGTVGMFLRYVDYPSEVTALARGAVGSLFIFSYLMVRKIPIDKKAVRENIFWLLLSGIFLGLNWIFLFRAYMTTTVAIASLCNYMAPIMVIMVAPLFLHERLDQRKLPCVAAAFLGIILVSGVIGGNGGDNVAGVFFGLTGAVCFTGLVICNRKLHDIAPMDKSFVQLAVSALIIFPYVLFMNRGRPMAFDGRSLLILLMLGVLHTGIAYCLYFSGLASLSVGTIAVLGYLEPVVSVLCSAVFLHEAMTVTGWIGAILILGAATISELVG